MTRSKRDGAPRTLHVRCGTWDEVTTFTSRKLRRGKLLSMKVPFTADVGASVTLGLELPNGLVIAIDGSDPQGVGGGRRRRPARPGSSWSSSASPTR